MRPQKIGDSTDILEKKRETETPIQLIVETTTEPVEIIGSGDEQVITEENKNLKYIINIFYCHFRMKLTIHRIIFLTVKQKQQKLIWMLLQ